MLLLFTALAAADLPTPSTGPAVEVDIGHSDSVVWFKLEAGAGRVPGVRGGRIEPLFQTRDPSSELSRWYRLVTSPGGAMPVVRVLQQTQGVAHVELEPLPLPPPADIAPTTPDLSAEQAYMRPAPEGFGLQEAARWPGGDGGNVAVADLEYDWESEHEDLVHLGTLRSWGTPYPEYAYHGTGVMGILAAGDNGYGVTGMVPAAEMVLIHPVTPEGAYNVARAIEASLELLQAGDVLLIEQQAWAVENYAPVEVSAAVFDAIVAATEAGIVVIEPAGNGGQDLDGADFGGWFDRSARDSGAILVGGGVPPGDGFLDTRSWYPSGSCYGERVDVQGWYAGIATTISAPYSGDLFSADDGLQSYWSGFGGTSGASPQVTAVAARFQSIAIALRGEPFTPAELRALMVQTGTPQANPEEAWIGPQPDLRRMLLAGGLR